jgi:hypothetical protein
VHVFVFTTTKKQKTVGFAAPAMGKRGRPSRHPEAVAADPSSHYAAGEPER